MAKAELLKADKKQIPGQLKPARHKNVSEDYPSPAIRQLSNCT